MEGNRTGFHRRAPAMAADLPPARSGDARHTTVPGARRGGGNRRWLAPRFDTRDSSNPDRLAQDEPAAWATGADAV
jgi:hypothetical protein